MLRKYTLLIAMFMFAFFGVELAAQTVPPRDVQAALVNGAHWTAQVKLTWQTANASYSSFNVYKKLGSVGDTLPYVRVASYVHGKSLIDVKVTTGNTYSYYVTSVLANVESDPSSAVEIAVVAPVAQQGWVYGTVTSSTDATPISKAYVNVFGTASGRENWNIVYTDANGSYAVKVDTGTYGVYFAKDHMPPKYFDNVSAFGQATVLTVHTGDSLQANGTLGGTTVHTARATGWVYGTVTADSDGTPLNRAYVNVFGVTSNNYKWNIVYTDANGKYAVKVDTGKYGVYFSKGKLVPEYFENSASFQSATLLTVNAGDSLNVNAGLATYVQPASYTLTGQVKDASGNPLKASISVIKLTTNTFFRGNDRAKTDSLGNYSIKVYAGDTLVVYAQPSDHSYLPQYFNNKETFADADRLGVAGDVTAVDFVLVPKPVYPNGISGLVTDSAGVAVVSHIDAYRLGAANGDSRYATVSDSLGQYAFTNFVPGKYILLANPHGALKATYFKYDGSTTLNWRNADSVVVDSSSQVIAVDFHLLPRSDTGHGIIRGLVHSNGNKAGAVVSAVDEQNKVVSYAIVDKNGHYSIEGLLPGSYKVSADLINYQTSVASAVAVNYTANSLKKQDLTINSTTATGTSQEVSVVSGFALYQNYPNPFNPSTMITFTLPQKENVTLTIYDVLGREVTKLINGVTAEGDHSVEFNAAGYASGMYIYKLEAPGLSISRKMLLLK